MFLMYVDECGDSGMGVGSSDYFILSGLVVHESMWTQLLTGIADELSGLKIKHGMENRAELHAKGMLGRSEKVYASMPKVSRLMMFRDVLKYEGTLTDRIRIINVVVDKRGKAFGYDAFGHAWDALINRFENTIQYNNFPIIAPSTTPACPEHGMIIVDQTDEKKLRELTRHMRHNNLIPSCIVPGSYTRHNLQWVIEDPMHKDSQHTLPIQLCDANAYFLRQMLAPNSTIRKHKAQNYFYSLEPVLLKEAAKRDPLGIVRL